MSFDDFLIVDLPLCYILISLFWSFGQYCCLQTRGLLAVALVLYACLYLHHIKKHFTFSNNITFTTDTVSLLLCTSLREGLRSLSTQTTGFKRALIQMRSEQDCHWKVSWEIECDILTEVTCWETQTHRFVTVCIHKSKYSRYRFKTCFSYTSKMKCKHVPLNKYK